MLRGVLILAAALLFALGAPGRTAPTFPALNGQRVVDDAHVLSPATITDLTNKLAALEQKNGDQVVVVTLPSLQGYAIEDYGYQLGRAWGIGQKGKDNGLIFIVVPSEHQVRIEVGYGLEPVMTDAMSSVILQSEVLPKFRSGDIEGGVVAGTNAILNQLGLDPAQAQSIAQAAAAPPAYQRPNPIPIIIMLVLFFFLIRALFGMRGGGFWMAAPFLFMGGGRSGGFSGGGFGGSGGFGGGFSGGGGSFGGGGASGSW